MIRLELTAEEAATLRHALESYISDLRMEIADTDRQDFREALKARRDALRRIADSLPGGPDG